MPAETNRVVPSDLPFAKPFTVPFTALRGQPGLDAPSGTRAPLAMMAPAMTAMPAAPDIPISVSAYIHLP